MATILTNLTSINAAYAAGQRDFVAWVYAIPFALVGAVLWGFGVWANRIARGPAAPPRAADRPPPP